MAFLAGSYVMFAEAGPAGFLRNAYKAGQALVDQARALIEKHGNDAIAEDFVRYL